MSGLQDVSIRMGIATECGFGHRPKETLPELMRIHRKVAELL